MIAKHGDALEADLLQFFHVDLLDLGSPRLSWRRLGVLIRNLPVEAATVTESTGDRHWTPAEHLLASVVDAVTYQSWLFVSANSKKKPKAPKPLRRPGDRKRGRARSSLTGSDMAARLMAQREREVKRRG